MERTYGVKLSSHSSSRPVTFRMRRRRKMEDDDDDVYGDDYDDDGLVESREARSMLCVCSY